MEQISGIREISNLPVIRNLPYMVKIFYYARILKITILVSSDAMDLFLKLAESSFILIYIHTWLVGSLVIQG